MARTKQTSRGSSNSGRPDRATFGSSQGSSGHRFSGSQCSCSGCRRRPAKKKKYRRSRYGATLDSTGWHFEHRQPSVMDDLPLHEVLQTPKFEYEDDEVEDCEDVSDEEEQDQCLGTLKDVVVGIQYYRGSTNPNEMVQLEREPHNLYDSNAVKVVNIVGDQVGHIQRGLARPMAFIMDQKLAKIEGSVGGKASRTTQLPIEINFMGAPEKKNQIHAIMRKHGYILKEPITSGLSEAGSGFATPSGIPGLNNRTILTPEDMKNELDQLFENLNKGDKDTTAEPAKALGTPLYPHQKQALNWMTRRENGVDLPPFWQKRGKKFYNTITGILLPANKKPKSVRGGILADDMGLGKTIQVIALILTNFRDGQPLAVPIEGSVRSTKIEKTRRLETYRKRHSKRNENWSDPLPKLQKSRLRPRKKLKLGQDIESGNDNDDPDFHPRVDVKESLEKLKKLEEEDLDSETTTDSENDSDSPFSQLGSQTQSSQKKKSLRPWITDSEMSDFDVEPSQENNIPKETQSPKPRDEQQQSKSTKEKQSPKMDSEKSQVTMQKPLTVSEKCQSTIPGPSKANEIQLNKVGDVLPRDIAEKPQSLDLEHGQKSASEIEMDYLEQMQAIEYETNDLEQMQAIEYATNDLAQMQAMEYDTTYLEQLQAIEYEKSQNTIARPSQIELSPQGEDKFAEGAVAEQLQAIAGKSQTFLHQDKDQNKDDDFMKNVESFIADHSDTSQVLEVKTPERVKSPEQMKSTFANEIDTFLETHKERDSPSPPQTNFSISQSEFSAMLSNSQSESTNITANETEKGQNSDVSEFRQFVPTTMDDSNDSVFSLGSPSKWGNTQTSSATGNNATTGKSSQVATSTTVINNKSSSSTSQDIGVNIGPSKPHVETVTDNPKHLTAKGDNSNLNRSFSGGSPMCRKTEKLFKEIDEKINLLESRESLSKPDASKTHEKVITKTKDSPRRDSYTPKTKLLLKADKSVNRGLKTGMSTPQASTPTWVGKSQSVGSTSKTTNNTGTTGKLSSATPTQTTSYTPIFRGRTHSDVNTSKITKNTSATMTLSCASPTQTTTSTPTFRGRAQSAVNTSTTSDNTGATVMLSKTPEALNSKPSTMTPAQIVSVHNQNSSATVTKTPNNAKNKLKAAMSKASGLLQDDIEITNAPKVPRVMQVPSAKSRPSNARGAKSTNSDIMPTSLKPVTSNLPRVSSTNAISSATYSMNLPPKVSNTVTKPAFNAAIIKPTSAAKSTPVTMKPVSVSGKQTFNLAKQDLTYAKQFRDGVSIVSPISSNTVSQQPKLIRITDKQKVVEVSSQSQLKNAGAHGVYNTSRQVVSSRAPVMLTTSARATTTKTPIVASKAHTILSTSSHNAASKTQTVNRISSVEPKKPKSNVAKSLIRSSAVSVPPDIHSQQNVVPQSKVAPQIVLHQNPGATQNVRVQQPGQAINLPQNPLIMLPQNAAVPQNTGNLQYMLIQGSTPGSMVLAPIMVPAGGLPNTGVPQFVLPGIQGVSQEISGIQGVSHTIDVPATTSQASDAHPNPSNINQLDGQFDSDTDTDANLSFEAERNESPVAFETALSVECIDRVYDKDKEFLSQGDATVHCDTYSDVNTFPVFGDSPIDRVSPGAMDFPPEWDIPLYWDPLAEDIGSSEDELLQVDGADDGGGRRSSRRNVKKPSRFREYEEDSLQIEMPAKKPCAEKTTDDVIPKPMIPRRPLANSPLRNTNPTTGPASPLPRNGSITAPINAMNSNVTSSPDPLFALYKHTDSPKRKRKSMVGFADPKGSRSLNVDSKASTSRDNAEDPTQSISARNISMETATMDTVVSNLSNAEAGSTGNPSAENYTMETVTTETVSFKANDENDLNLFLPTDTDDDIEAQPKPSTAPVSNIDAAATVSMEESEANDENYSIFFLPTDTDDDIEARPKPSTAPASSNIDAAATVSMEERLRSDYIQNAAATGKETPSNSVNIENPSTLNNISTSDITELVKTGSSSTSNHISTSDTTELVKTGSSQLTKPTENVTAITNVMEIGKVPLKVRNVVHVEGGRTFLKTFIQFEKEGGGITEIPGGCTEINVDGKLPVLGETLMENTQIDGKSQRENTQNDGKLPQKNTLKDTKFPSNSNLNSASSSANDKDDVFDIDFDACVTSSKSTTTGSTEKHNRKTGESSTSSEAPSPIDLTENSPPTAPDLQNDVVLLDECKSPEVQIIPSVPNASQEEVLSISDDDDGWMNAVTIPAPSSKGSSKSSLTAGIGKGCKKPFISKSSVGRNTSGSYRSNSQANVGDKVPPSFQNNRSGISVPSSQNSRSGTLVSSSQNNRSDNIPPSFQNNRPQPSSQSEPRKSSKRKCVIDSDDDEDLPDLPSLTRPSTSTLPQYEFSNVFDEGSGRNKNAATRATLIVCPLSVISNWVNQIEDHVSERVHLSVFTFYGTNKKITKEKLAQMDIVITTYHTVASDAKTGRVLQGVEWLRIVLDEGHIIRNPKTQLAQAVLTLKAERKWVLTGTPIQNSIRDLWSLINFLGISPFTDRIWWRRVIERPLLAKEQKAMKRIQHLIGCIAMRRLKTQSIAGRPIIDIPERRVYLEHVEFSEEERKTYESMQAEGKLIVSKYFKQGTLLHNYGQVLAILMRLRQICIHPFLVAKAAKQAAENPNLVLTQISKGDSIDPTLRQNLIEKIQEVLGSGSAEECSICLDELKQPVITHCAHLYCKPCIERVIETTDVPPCMCPMCRAEVDKNKLMDVPNEILQGGGNEEEEELYGGPWQSSAKVDALMAQLIHIRGEDPSVKSVITSQFTSLLTVLERPLRDHGFNFVKLIGSMSSVQRTEAIEIFSDVDPRSPTIMLLSLTAGGVGINLTAASRVYLMDPAWNPASEEQVFDRVHRLGQTREVIVTKFIVEGTVEERMLELQEKKRQLIAGALGQKMSQEQRRNNRINEIRNLMDL